MDSATVRWSHSMIYSDCIQYHMHSDWSTGPATGLSLNKAASAHSTVGFHSKKSLLTLNQYWCSEPYIHLNSGNDTKLCNLISNSKLWKRRVGCVFVARAFDNYKSRMTTLMSLPICCCLQPLEIHVTAKRKQDTGAGLIPYWTELVTMPFLRVSPQASHAQMGRSFSKFRNA